jgi:hypothetical protein
MWPRSARRSVENTTTTPKEAVMHEYIAQKVYEDRATTLRAEAAAYRLAGPAVRRPQLQRRRRPWWPRVNPSGQPADLRSA